jgi:hypothetical protein
MTTEIDEDTSEVKSSSVVKWEENLPMGFHSKEKPKQIIIKIKKYEKNEKEFKNR